MKKQEHIQYCLCVDWETSGASFGEDSTKKYQGLTFGAIVADVKTFEPIEKLYREIKFDSSRYSWSDEAEKIHGISREYLAQHGVSREEAAIALLELIVKYWGPGGKVMLLGHNTEFDRRFTNQLLLDMVDVEFSTEKTPNSTSSWVQLHHVILDTSALGFITLGLFKSDLLFDRIGFPPRDKHNSLSDAEMTLQTCQAIRTLVEISLEPQ